MKIFDSEFWNPVNFCLWNSESSKFLLVKSGIQKIFAFRIWNLGNFCFWNSESRAWKCGTQLHESGIPLTIGIQNPSSTRNSGIQNPRLSWDGGHEKEQIIRNRNNMMKSTTGPGTDPCRTPKHF